MDAITLLTQIENSPCEGDVVDCWPYDEEDCSDADLCDYQGESNPEPSRATLRMWHRQSEERAAREAAAHTEFVNEYGEDAIPF